MAQSVPARRASDRAWMLLRNTVAKISFGSAASFRGRKESVTASIRSRDGSFLKTRCPSSAMDCRMIQSSDWDAGAKRGSTQESLTTRDMANLQNVNGGRHPGRASPPGDGKQRNKVHPPDRTSVV